MCEVKNCETNFQTIEEYQCNDCTELFVKDGVIGTNLNDKLKYYCTTCFRKYLFVEYHMKLKFISDDGEVVINEWNETRNVDDHTNVGGGELKIGGDDTGFVPNPNKI
jgi:hypothetical protein